MKLKIRKIPVIEISQKGVRLIEEDEAYLEESLRVRIWKVIKRNCYLFFNIAIYVVNCILNDQGLKPYMHFICGAFIALLARSFYHDLLKEIFKK